MEHEFREVPLASGTASINSKYPTPVDAYERMVQRSWVENARRVVALQGDSYIAALQSGAQRIYDADETYRQLAAMPLQRTAPARNKHLREPHPTVTADLLSGFALIGPLSHGATGIPESELHWKNYHAPPQLVSSHFAEPSIFKPADPGWKVGDAGLPNAAQCNYIDEQFYVDTPNVRKADLFRRLGNSVSAMSFPDIVVLLTQQEWLMLSAARRYGSVSVEANYIQELVSRMVSWATDRLQRMTGSILSTDSSIQAQALAAFRAPLPAGAGTFHASTPYVQGDPRITPVNSTLFGATAFESSVDPNGKTISNWGVLPFRTTAVAL